MILPFKRLLSEGLEPFFLKRLCSLSRPSPQGKFILDTPQFLKIILFRTGEAEGGLSLHPLLP